MKLQIKRFSVEKRFNFLRTAVALGLALTVAVVIILFISESPGVDVRTFILGPVSETMYIESLLTRMVPLCFTGLAVCIMFAGGQLNLGAEGAYFAGAIACAVVAIFPKMASGIHPVVAMVAGGLVGAIFCGLSGLLKVKFNVMTVVSSLMLNYVALNLGMFVMLEYLLDTSAGYRASYQFADSAKLPALISGSNIHFGFIVLLLAIIASHVLINRSCFGYSIRMVGQNMKFAQYSGMNVANVIIGSQIIGGFLAGLGASVELLGMYSRFTYNGLTNHGWDGVMIAVLARNNPKSVWIAALFLSYLRTSADILNRTSNIPNEVIKIVQAVVIVFIAARAIFSKLEHKATLQESGVVGDFT